ncbi:MAG: hypothetical protein KGK10_11670 [Rhodospirillales bacterium]|nr:hypothetical protein [Rhodospirillales bacterium]
MSTKQGADDGRVVVGLWHASLDAAAMQQAAEVARLLSADLYGLFIEDEALLAMAALPFAREIHYATRTWRALRPDAVESEMREAAREAQRLLDHAARATGIASAFEVMRGDPAACITAACRAGDILVLAEQAEGGVRAAQDAWRLREAAAQAACSILLLPERPAHRHGAIAAVLGHGDDSVFATACALAAATGEDLALLLEDETGPQAAAALVARARAEGLEHQRITARPLGGAAPGAVPEALAALPARLLVLARSWHLADTASREAAARGLPVLLLGEPPSP